MCVEYRQEDRELFKQFKKYEALWKARSAELANQMVEEGVDKVYSEDGLDYMKLVNMPECVIPNYTRKGFSYIRFN